MKSCSLTPYLVSWKDNVKPRLLTSVNEILEAERNEELVIEPTKNVVNALMIVWDNGSKQQTATEISNLFKSMKGVTGTVVMADTDMYILRMSLISQDKMQMMK